MNSVEQNSDEIYREKYKDLLSPSDAYQFFLKIQFMIPNDFTTFYRVFNPPMACRSFNITIMI